MQGREQYHTLCLLMGPYENLKYPALLGLFRLVFAFGGFRVFLRGLVLPDTAAAAIALVAGHAHHLLPYLIKYFSNHLNFRLKNFRSFL